MSRKNRKGNKKESSKEKEIIFKSVAPNKRAKINSLAENLLKITSQEVTNYQMNWDNYVQANTILNKLRELEPPMYVRNREEHFDELLSWVKVNGGMTDNVTIKKFDNMEYGLAAKRDLEEGEVICSVPSKLTFGLNYVEESSLKVLANRDPVLKGMGNVRLALLLILEYFKGTKSFWYPYIASLPAKYNTVLYFTLMDCGELKYSPMFGPCLNLFTSIARQYAYFHKVFQTSNDDASQILKNLFTYDMYRWAVSTVMTRQNILPFGTKTINAFIPLWDMCNHADGYVSTFSTDEENVCKAFKPFREGEQIFIHYGNRHKEDFFLHNGFVYEGDDETYLLRLGISKSDVLHQLRSGILTHHGLANTSEFHIQKNVDPMTPEIETFLTVVNMDEDELRQCQSDPEKTLPKGPEIAYKNYRYFYMRLNLLLSQHEGEKEANHSNTTRLVRAQIESEKRCLRSALKFIQEKLQSLKNEGANETG